MMSWILRKRPVQEGELSSKHAGWVRKRASTFSALPCRMKKRW
ncbi:hypothetical protein [Lactonifactor longoviformis]